MTKQPTARMKRLVTQWRRSGESQASFARRHEIPTWTFWYWCRKLLKDAAAVPQASSAAFVPVRVTSEPDVSVVEVVLPAGERVRVSAGASADLVQLVVTALRSTC